jgi:hypothetical protein
MAKPAIAVVHGFEMARRLGQSDSAFEQDGLRVDLCVEFSG